MSTTEVVPQTGNALAIPSLPAREQEAAELALVPLSVEVSDAESFAYAGGVFRRASAYLKALDGDFKEIDRLQIDARNATIRLHKRLEAPALALRDAASKAAGAWEREQARLALEAAQAAQRDRERQEQAARAEAAKEQARLNAQAEDVTLAAAVEAERRGDPLLAERIISAPVVAPTVVARPVFTPPPAVQAALKLDGVGFRTYYSCAVDDLPALVAAVIAGTAPAIVVQANQVALNAMAEAMKGSFRLPGCRLVEERRPVNQRSRV